MYKLATLSIDFLENVSHTCPHSGRSTLFYPYIPYPPLPSPLSSSLHPHICWRPRRGVRTELETKTLEARTVERGSIDRLHACRLHSNSSRAVHSAAAKWISGEEEVFSVCPPQVINTVFFLPREGREKERELRCQITIKRGFLCYQGTNSSPGERKASYSRWPSCPPSVRTVHDSPGCHQLERARGRRAEKKREERGRKRAEREKERGKVI